MRRYVLRDFMDIIEKFKVTNLILIPPQVMAIINLSNEQPEYVRRCLRSVVAVVGGAAPLDKDSQQALQDLLPKASVVTQLWAMTETSCVAPYFYFPENDYTGSVGRFLPDVNIKLVDENDKEIFPPFGKRGDLCGRGPTVIRGYLNSPEANCRDWDEDNFFHTGDMVFCDGKMKLWYVVDRKKELIKARRFQVAPAELEGVLLTHPGVRDVAVIGIPAAQVGSELPRAYIIQSEGLS